MVVEVLAVEDADEVSQLSGNPPGVEAEGLDELLNHQPVLELVGCFAAEADRQMLGADVMKQLSLEGKFNKICLTCKNRLYFNLTLTIFFKFSFNFCFKLQDQTNVLNQYLVFDNVDVKV